MKLKQINSSNIGTYQSNLPQIFKGLTLFICSIGYIIYSQKPLSLFSLIAILIAVFAVVVIFSNVGIKANLLQSGICEVRKKKFLQPIKTETFNATEVASVKLDIRISGRSTARDILIDLSDGRSISIAEQLGGVFYQAHAEEIAQQIATFFNAPFVKT